jgi:hypothetical protein
MVMMASAAVLRMARRRSSLSRSASCAECGAPSAMIFRTTGM